MSSRREVLIRILALLQGKTLIEIAHWKSHMKMLKKALFDCAINEKCCSVDGGRGICPLFSSPPRGILQLKSPQPREFAIQGKMNANSRRSAWGRGGGGSVTNINILLTPADHQEWLWELINWLPKGERFELTKFSRLFQKKCTEISLENLYVDLGT